MVIELDDYRVSCLLDMTELDQENPASFRVYVAELEDSAQIVLEIESEDNENPALFTLNIPREHLGMMLVMEPMLKKMFPSESDE